jgi:predicted secreted protein
VKRDDDYLRKLLFEFEAQEDWLIIAVETLSMSQEERKRQYHVLLATDAGFVAQAGKYTYRLTAAGHDFLDAVRNEGIWEKTKEGAATVGGTTLGIMKDIAVAYVKQAAAEKLGLIL